MKSRTPVIVSSVVLFHVAALWALHAGLLQRMVEVVVPVMAISQAEPPPAPPPPKPPEPVKPPEPPKTPPPPKPVQPVLTPPTTPQTLAPATPEPPAVLAAPTAAPTAPAVQAAAPAPPPPPAPPAPAPVTPAPPPPAKVELPSSKADYLHNPPPDYPRMSKRLGEQGKVVVKVLIGEDGRAQKVELLTTSGFERLDKSAMEAAMRWRYVPGKRGGVAEAMWYQVPIQFTLE
jgi:periplasmic protein TonB